MDIMTTSPSSGESHVDIMSTSLSSGECRRGHQVNYSPWWRGWTWTPCLLVSLVESVIWTSCLRVSLVESVGVDTKSTSLSGGEGRRGHHVY